MSFGFDFRLALAQLDGLKCFEANAESIKIKLGLQFLSEISSASLGSSCGTAVEDTPGDREVVSSNPAGIRAFSVLLSFFLCIPLSLSLSVVCP